jgi:CBS domain-containing protein
MNSVYDLKADKIMNEEPVKVEMGKSLSQIKNKMEEHNLRAIPVVDEKNVLEGVVGYRDLIRFIQFNPETTKVSKVIHQPPEFELSDTLVDLADLRINSGRKMLVSTANGKLRGVIGDQEFADAMKDVEELEKTSTRSLCSEDLITVFEDESLEEARHKMLDNNISRVPVTDKQGNLTGIIHSTDMLKTLVPRDRQNSGGTSGNREGNEVYIQGGGEKQKMSDVPASEIMNRMVNTSKEHMDVSEALAKMADQETFEIVFVDDKYPETIVTLKDFIDEVSDHEQENAILVSLVGLDLPEEKAAVHKKVKNQLQGGLGRKLENPDELRLRIKKADKDGKKHRYEIDFQLVCEYGVISLSAEEWDLLDAVDEGLGELDTIVAKKKDKRSDHQNRN